MAQPIKGVGGEVEDHSKASGLELRQLRAQRKKGVGGEVEGHSKASGLELR